LEGSVPVASCQGIRLNRKRTEKKDRGIEKNWVKSGGKSRERKKLVALRLFEKRTETLPTNVGKEIYLDKNILRTTRGGSLYAQESQRSVQLKKRARKLPGLLRTRGRRVPIPPVN